MCNNRLRPLVSQQRALHTALRTHQHTTLYRSVHTMYLIKIFAVQRSVVRAAEVDVAVVQEGEQTAVQVQLEILESCALIQNLRVLLVSRESKPLLIG